MSATTRCPRRAAPARAAAQPCPWPTRRRSARTGAARCRRSPRRMPSVTLLARPARTRTSRRRSRHRPPERHDDDLHLHADRERVGVARCRASTLACRRQLHVADGERLEVPRAGVRRRFGTNSWAVNVHNVPVRSRSCSTISGPCSAGSRPARGTWSRRRHRTGADELGALGRPREQALSDGNCCCHPKAISLNVDQPCQLGLTPRSASRCRWCRRPRSTPRRGCEPSPRSLRPRTGCPARG